MDHAVSAEEHSVFTGRRQRMVRIQRDLFSAAVLCPEADIGGFTVAFACLQPAERDVMEHSVLRRRHIRSRHRRALRQGEAYRQKQFFVHPVTVDLDQEVHGITACRICDRHKDAAVFTDVHIRDVLQIQPGRLRIRIGNERDPDSVRDTHDRFCIRIPPFLRFILECVKTCNSQAVYLAVLHNGYGFAGNSLQTDALNTAHGHRGHALCEANSAAAIHQRIADKACETILTDAAGEYPLVLRVRRQFQRRGETKRLKQARLVLHLVRGVMLRRTDDPRRSISAVVVSPDFHWSPKGRPRRITVCVEVAHVLPLVTACLAQPETKINPLGAADIQIMLFTIVGYIQIRQFLKIQRIFLQRTQ